jgi:hypothetical protein
VRDIEIFLLRHFDEIWTLLLHSAKNVLTKNIRNILKVKAKDLIGFPEI